MSLSIHGLFDCVGCECSKTAFAGDDVYANEAGVQLVDRADIGRLIFRRIIDTAIEPS